MRVEPDPVEQGEIAIVTVSLPANSDPSGWLMRVVSAQGSVVVLPARGLDTYVARTPQPGTHECEVDTAAFKPGVYLVDISPMASFELSDTASARFTVDHPMPIVISANMSDFNRSFPRYWSRRGML